MKETEGALKGQSSKEWWKFQVKNWEKLSEQWEKKVHKCLLHYPSFFVASPICNMQTNFCFVLWAQERSSWFLMLLPTGYMLRYLEITILQNFLLSTIIVSLQIDRIA